jgi:hypothetical protein
VALILAINPGNSHSPTLARLARELKGYELIGAESCAIAMTAMKERVPVLVLLPDRTPRGEAELLLKLKTIPGGVPTLRLPAVTAADPPALAKEIRAVLESVKNAPPPPPKATAPAKSKHASKQGGPLSETGTTKPTAAPRQPAPATPAGPSPHVIAAAKAAINWIHTRSAHWAEIDALARQPIVVAAAAATYESVGLRAHESDEPTGSRIDEHDEWRPTNELDEIESAPARSPMATWLPRVAVLAVLIGGAWAGMTFWPRTNNVVVDAGPVLDRATEPAPEPLHTGVLPPVATQPETATTPIPDPASGWVAVTAPFEISITNADEPVTLDPTGRGMLMPGKYQLRFRNAELGYDETRAIEVRATATTTVNLRPQTTISVSSNEPADVLIDGKPVGQTPYDGPLSFGTHTVTVKTAGGQRETTINATMKPVQLDIDFSQPQP